MAIKARSAERKKTIKDNFFFFLLIAPYSKAKASYSYRRHSCCSDTNRTQSQKHSILLAVFSRSYIFFKEVHKKNYFSLCEYSHFLISCTKRSF
ncbi:hypothetical protein A946_03335 [Methylacidiphilum kamchatkense Kam1]|uniref:Uncharacterized protein n=1 Tax=Methylacidiphilum kamchatkense Kam1 TaxID=1202785 RepID=A0ABR4ZZ89_9BACT|nr:hypothetical protein A946_03335 [Methylacidiphilum kamchatkense Kam1]